MNMNVRLGSAPAAWGVSFASDPKQTPWTRYLDEVAEAGYTWTELGPYGYLPTDPKQAGARTGPAQSQTGRRSHHARTGRARGVA